MWQWLRQTTVAVGRFSAYAATLPPQRCWLGSGSLCLVAGCGRVVGVTAIRYLSRGVGSYE